MTLARRLLAAIALSAATAVACPELPLAPDGPNAFDLQYGATNVNAVLGSGGLTAAYSRCGELTVLKWPGPSYYSQLNYLSSNAPDARTVPHFGALDSSGAFPGIAYTSAKGGGFTWLRDDAWVHAQHYTSDTSDVLVDDATNASLGLHAVGLLFVLPDRDVLVGSYTVTRLPGSPVRRATMIFYTNFSPSLARLPFFPVADWALDFENDFAVAYDRHERALLHFVPSSAASYPHDFAVVNGFLRSPPSKHGKQVRAVQSVIDGLTEPGVYIAAAVRGHDDGYQAGFDDAPLCPHQSSLANRAVDAFALPPVFDGVARSLFVCDHVVTDPAGPLAACRSKNGWTYAAESAYGDAQDGKLWRSPLAACQANAALARRLHFGRGGKATATIYVAIAGTRDAAYTLLHDARRGDPGRQRAATETWWSQFVAPAHLPDTDDQLVRAFARRSLIAARTAVDNASGAIVASVATQSPYGADWPRDGSFINHALDLAGYADIVGRHDRFYARVQRKQPGSWSVLYPFPPCNPAAPVEPDCIPAGTFETNYYADPADAVPANPISFEIDEAGLGVWTMWDHAQYVTDATARAAYLADVCASIHLGVVNLAACRDATNHLQCFANEDDQIPRSQGLQGAETVLLALQTGVAAASACGFDAGEVAGWQARAAELTQAIHDNFLATDHYVGGRPGWLLWPVSFFAPGDPLAGSHAAWLKQTSIDPILQRTAASSSYDAENLVARGAWLRANGDTAGLAALQDEVRFFIRELTTPGTLHMSEAYARVQADLNGDGVAPDYVAENDVAHVWEHAYLYTAAMLAFGSR